MRSLGSWKLKAEIRGATRGTLNTASGEARTPKKGITALIDTTSAKEVNSINAKSNEKVFFLLGSIWCQSLIRSFIDYRKVYTLILLLYSAY